MEEIFLDLIEYYNVKFLLFIIFLIPLCYRKKNWWLIQFLILIISFIFIFSFPFYFCWGEIWYIFGCDIISFGLVLLRIWICVLIIMARESIYYYNYFRGFFVFIIVILILHKVHFNMCWPNPLHDSGDTKYISTCVDKTPRILAMAQNYISSCLDQTPSMLARKQYVFKKPILLWQWGHKMYLNFC